MTGTWEFPTNSGGRWEGFNNSGIEYFTGNPYSSLAREIIQNSLDARRKDNNKPVKVFFDLVQVDRSDFPGIGSLKTNFQKKLKQAQDLKDSKAERFFSSAINKVFSNNKFSVLRISDTNTTGLEGPCELGKPFHSLMKSEGQSTQATETAGGSYGIGKNAPFAISDLRTVMVSTKYGTKGKYQDLAQGKSILMSHKDSTGSTVSSTGYFGEDNCMPLSSASDIPGWMRREEQFESIKDHKGTTIFIIGFRPNNNWKILLVTSIISNYFCALYEEKLEVFIDQNQIKLTKDTLFKWFEDKHVLAAARLEEQDETFELAHQMAQCLQNVETKEEFIQMQSLKNCRLRILVGDGFRKRVGIIRNGMLVTYRLKHLQQFFGFSDFIAIVDFLTDGGNAYLRKLENPEHNYFEPDRLGEGKEILAARMELRRLAKKVRDNLKKYAQTETSDISDLDELSEFFQDLDEESPLPESEEGESVLEGRIKIVAKPTKIKTRPIALADEDGDEEGSGGGIPGPSPEPVSEPVSEPFPGPVPGPFPGPNFGSKAASPIVLTSQRTIYDHKKPGFREIIFTPERSGTATLSFYDVGADVIEKLLVKKVSGFRRSKLKNGLLENVELKAGVRCQLKLTWVREFSGAVKVTAHEV